MGLEDELKGFVAPYEALLKDIAKFINPFIVGKRTEKLNTMKELVGRRAQFLKSFEQLPISPGSSLVRTISGNPDYNPDDEIWHQVGYFCGDLTVLELDYDKLRLGFSYLNQKVSPGDQAMYTIQRTPIPGSTLEDGFNITLKKSVDLNWNFVEPNSRKILHDPEIVYSNESEQGLMELDFNTCSGRFLSQAALQEGKPSAIVFKTLQKRTDTSRMVGYASFSLKQLGYGELDAFMRHLGVITSQQS